MCSYQEIEGEVIADEKWIPTQVTDSNDGERGRNRTYNLLLKRQAPEINGFSDFPTFSVGSLRQLWSPLLPNLLPSGGCPGSKVSSQSPRGSIACISFPSRTDTDHSAPPWKHCAEAHSSGHWN